MPGEEMEITTDFGQAGFGEDIDIDLDFAVGQTDEDMELADFDQVQEIPNFNSDTRDELMAEGDDASYGMIDADDIENNEVAVASNDIEIDLGDPEESLWQQNAAPEENFEPVVEIDIVEATDVGNANVNTENVGTGQGSWLEASTYSINKPDEVDATQVDVGTIDATGDNLLPNSEVLIEDDVASQDLGLAVTEGDNAETLDVGENNNIEAESRIQNAYDEQQNVPADASLQESTKEPVVDEQHEQQEHEENDDSRSDKHASEGNNIYETHKDVQHQASGDDVSEIGYDSDDNDDNSLQHGEQPSAPVASDHGSVAEHHVEQEQERVNQQDPTDLGDIEQQLGSNLHDEPANDHESSNQTYSKEETGVPDADETQSQSDQHNAGHQDLEAAVAGDQEKTPRATEAFVEHPLSVATRHEMYISYGNTDYRLFAKSEADDPNKYFLSDMAALEFPLGQLLSSLRDVISDELSPLDELVMHVDGLGLEFSESSTAEILEKFTFGDILGLYDRLVKNDGSEPPPDLYTYLMVRPNCRQRFIALRDSADSGRGLSEIAIFREDTPIDGEGAGEFDSHSPYALPSGEEEDEAYDYEESGAVEDEADQGEAGEVENNDEPNSPSVHGSAIGTNTEDPTGEAVEAAEADAADVASEADEADDADEAGENDDNNADASADATTADGLIDFSDDELDLSSTKQDQQANGSPHDRTDEIQNEHDAFTATERSYPNQHSSPINGTADAPSSNITSATATLNGDDKDEIDYSDDDGEEITGGNDVTSNSGISVSATLKVPINDEITWESEDEDAQDEPVTTSKATVQVSPVSGKRARSDSDLDEGVTERSDVKRRRPS